VAVVVETGNQTLLAMMVVLVVVTLGIMTKLVVMAVELEHNHRLQANLDNMVLVIQADNLLVPNLNLMVRVLEAVVLVELVLQTNKEQELAMVVLVKHTQFLVQVSIMHMVEAVVLSNIQTDTMVSVKIQVVQTVWMDKQTEVVAEALVLVVVQKQQVLAVLVSLL
jgi:hypothetical protein